MAPGALGRALAFFLMAALAECVAVLHAPLLVRREVGALVADIALILSLMLGMGEIRGLLASFGLQGDLGRALGGSGESGACNSKPENKRESGGTDNGFLHCSSPLIQFGL